LSVTPVAGGPPPVITFVSQWTIPRPREDLRIRSSVYLSSLTREHREQKK
jgi:hypothetical protein